MGIVFIDSGCDEVRATNRFRLGDFSCAHLRLENHAQGRAPKRIPLTMIGESFYAKRRALRPGRGTLRAAPAVEHAAQAPAAAADDG